MRPIGHDRESRDTPDRMGAAGQRRVVASFVENVTGLIDEGADHSERLPLRSSLNKYLDA